MSSRSPVPLPSAMLAASAWRPVSPPYLPQPIGRLQRYFRRGGHRGQVFAAAARAGTPVIRIGGLSSILVLPELIAIALGGAATAN